MICTCSYSDDGEPWALVREETRTARKRYICCECGEAIEPGTRYEYVTGRLRGYSTWEVYRTCATCVRIRTDLCPTGWIYGDLAETVRECLEVEL